MEMLLSNNILTLKLLPSLSNVSILTLKPWFWGITHVLNFEHISLQSPSCRLQWFFFNFSQYNYPMFVALFSLACVLVSKSLSQNQVFFQLFQQHNKNDIVVHPTPNN